MGILWWKSGRCCRCHRHTVRVVFFQRVANFIHALINCAFMFRLLNFTTGLLLLCGFKFFAYILFISCLTPANCNNLCRRSLRSFQCEQGESQATMQCLCFVAVVGVWSISPSLFVLNCNGFWNEMHLFHSRMLAYASFKPTIFN